MMTRLQMLEPLARRRTNEIVITTMAVVRPWGRLSHHDLDFASADSAMGHAADLALGVALARPERRVLCINGDGSMLMSLGTLVTIANAGTRNLILVVAQNGTYEITGNQPLPGVGRTDLAGMAHAAGFRRTYSFADAAEYEACLDEILQEPGPTFVGIAVETGEEGPISRTSREQAAYLQTSLADWARHVRSALLADTEA